MRISDDVLALTKTQNGLITRAQAMDLGMSPEAIRHALGRDGGWQRITRGVYATFTGPIQLRHQVHAAVLYAGPDAVVTGAEACQAYGLRYVPDGGLPVILVPNAVQRVSVSIARIRRVRVMPERRTIDGIPVAVPERAALDACFGQRSLRTVRALLCEAVQRGLALPATISAQLGRARWEGAGLIRTALADLEAGCRSAPECELRDLIRRSTTLVEPLWNKPLPELNDGSLFPDACWQDARVVVEIDSAEWHRFGDRVEQTERRRARYAALGWTVLPISPRRLRQEPDAVLAEIESAVREGLARHKRAA